MDVFSLVAKLTLDSSEYDKNLDSAGKSASAFGDKLKSGLVTAAKVGAAAITAVTTATAAMTTAFVKGASDVAAYGDNIDKMSQKMGLSAEAYQEWDAVMQHSGTSIESLQAGMKTLANAVENGNEAFERLGITQEDIAGMNNEELFSATITALQNVENETERTYLAGQLLGRGATELGALLNTSAEDTQAMKDRVHELGGVLSDDAVKAAARFQDSLQDMQTAFAGLKRGMVADFLPAISDVMDGLTELFAGGDGKEQITQGIEGVVNGISDAAPRMLEVGSKILLALGEAITENLPALIEAGANVVLTLAKGIMEQFPAIIDAAIEIVLTLTDAIIENVDELIPAIAKTILTIVEKLTEPETLEKLIEAAIQLTIAIAKGLIEALPYLLQAVAELFANLFYAIGEEEMKLFEAGANIVKNLWQGLKSAIDEAKQWGRDLIDNFVQGIKDRIQHVIDTVKGVAQKVKDFLGFSEPKTGPLSDFHTYAPDMMKLFAQGIRDNERLITDQIDKSFDFGTRTVDFAASGVGRTASSSANYGGSKSSIPKISINFTGDLAQLAQILRPEIEYEGQRVGAAAVR